MCTGSAPKATASYCHIMLQLPGTPPFIISCSTFNRSALDVMLSSLYLSVGFRGIRFATQKLNFSASVAEGLSPALATNSANLECLLPTAIALRGVSTTECLFLMLSRHTNWRVDQESQRVVYFYIAFYMQLRVITPHCIACGDKAISEMCTGCRPLTGEAENQMRRLQWSQ